MIFRRKKQYTVYTYGAPVLKKKAEPVVRIDGNIMEIASEMLQAVRIFEGIGLAAPQIGISMKMMALALPADPEKGAELASSPGEAQLLPRMPMILLNPEIVAFSPALGIRDEGCLSVPEIYAPVIRPLSITLRAITIEGEVIQCECGGLLGRCIQHEMDHLEGILFVDRLTPDEFAKIEPELKALEKIGKGGDFKRKIAG
jgi:peptide deformylase